jgi:multidrug efflux system outer membrane protein
LILVAALAGCAVGPDYQRPEVAAPAEHRRAADDATAPTTNSIADLGFWEVYQDPQLNAYIAEALTNNWDIRIAAARVLQAEAAARVTRSQFWPTVTAGGDLVTTRSSENLTPVPPGTDTQLEYGSAYLAMPAYEIDLWGRLRRANEAARARLLGTSEAERTVRQTIVAQVATAYFRLLELDEALTVSQLTLTNSTVSFDLAKTREEGGVASMQDVYQAEALVRRSEASIASVLQRIGQQENELCILLGRNPGPIARGTRLTAQTRPDSVPAGLPSSLLERRPDLLAAEQELVAANADVGQAKAAFFPQVTLTGFAGFQSVSLSDLFSSGSRTWQFGPTVTMPLFTGGRLRGNLQQAQARFEESVAGYQKTVQNAFREVSDALIAYQRTREFRERQQQLTAANRSATELAGVRYEGGVTSYLEVTYNQQQLFDAELLLAQAQRDELLSLVQLYRALGGGWILPEATTAAAR